MATAQTPQRHRVRHEDRNHGRFLTCSCFQRLPFLTSDRARQWFIDAVQRARDRHRFELWAYVVMPEHFHLLLFPSPPARRVGPILTTIKQPVTRRAVAWVRRHAPAFLAHMHDAQPNGEESHRFWQRGGGYDRNLWSPKHIWETIDYIHENPVQRGLCRRPGDWRWSSYSAMHGGDGPLRLDRDHLPGRPG